LRRHQKTNNNKKKTKKKKEKKNKNVGGVGRVLSYFVELSTPKYRCRLKKNPLRQKKEENNPALTKHGVVDPRIFLSGRGGGPLLKTVAREGEWGVVFETY